MNLTHINVNFVCRPTSSQASRILYVWIALLFVIARSLAVFLVASHVNNESKKTIKILHFVPSNLWDMEVKRFADEISCNTAALSGMKFFSLTHTLVLSVASTIATYELFLMQY